MQFNKSMKAQLGNWGGERAALERLGVVFTFISDVANGSRVRGHGRHRLRQWRVSPMCDLPYDGALAGRRQHWGYIGSTANPSGMVSTDTTRLDSWWFEQARAKNKLFIRAGRRSTLPVTRLAVEILKSIRPAPTRLDIERMRQIKQAAGAGTAEA